MDLLVNRTCSRVEVNFTNITNNAIQYNAAYFHHYCNATPRVKDVRRREKVCVRREKKLNERESRRESA